MLDSCTEIYQAHEDSNNNSHAFFIILELHLKMSCLGYQAFCLEGDGWFLLKLFVY